VGMVVGIIFWGGFNTTMEATNTMTFCISCHERTLAKGETCIDCHDGIAHELPERPNDNDD